MADFNMREYIEYKAQDNGINYNGLSVFKRGRQGK
ncbi:hypothetical protein JOD02_001509 [Caldicoprobacter guelmensis]|nr:hypothetical protein [Caldicoprobacter guelmensis]